MIKWCKWRSSRTMAMVIKCGSRNSRHIMFVEKFSENDYD